MIARYFSAVDDINGLRSVFQDYLKHCQELFEHLPKEEPYAWLRDYREDGRSEDAEIVGFLVDLVGEPEIEQAKRLVRVLADLAKVRPKMVCRVTCEGIMKGEPLLRERLGMLIESLALVCPAALASHIETLTPLLKEQNFRLRMTLIRTIRCAAASAAIPASVSSAVDSAEREYSPLIAYPTRRFIHSEPSIEFVRFLRRAVLFDLNSRIAAVSELLKISPAVILAYLERTLHTFNWSVAEETERLKDDWRYHADDKRVVWIVPRFHMQVSELLQKFVHQAVENGRYRVTTLQALENILRVGDPAYVATLPQVKPRDIPALPIADGTKWWKNFILLLKAGSKCFQRRDGRQSMKSAFNPKLTGIVRC